MNAYVDDQVTNDIWDGNVGVFLLDFQESAHVVFVVFLLLGVLQAFLELSNAEAGYHGEVGELERHVWILG